MSTTYTNTQDFYKTFQNYEAEAKNDDAFSILLEAFVKPAMASFDSQEYTMEMQEMMQELEEMKNAMQNGSADMPYVNAVNAAH